MTTKNTKTKKDVEKKEEVDFFEVGLADIIIDQIENPDKPVPTISDEKFMITTTDTAYWAVKVVKSEYEKSQDIINAVDDEIEKLKKFKEKVMERTNRNTAFLKDRLIKYLTKFTENSKSKSMATPYGTIGMRRLAGKLEYTDEEAALNYMLENYPDMVKTVYKISKTDIKKLIKETGENIPGVEIEEGRETFYINDK